MDENQAQVTTKKPWQSKTIWIGIAMAIAPLFPPVEQWIAQNPEVFASVLSGFFALLRFLTKDKITIK